MLIIILYPNRIYKGESNEKNFIDKLFDFFKEILTDLFKDLLDTILG